MLPILVPSGCRAGAIEAKNGTEVNLVYQKFSDPRAASRFLAQREEARLLGGGTLLVRCVNEGDVSIGTYVRLHAPELQQIEVGDNVVRLGASVAMSTIARIPALAFLAPVARSIGGPAVRAAATVGGNLFAPNPYGDFGVALLALDAVVAIEGPEGAREQDLESFFKSRARAIANAVFDAIGVRIDSLPLSPEKILRALQAGGNDTHRNS